MVKPLAQPSLHVFAFAFILIVIGLPVLACVLEIITADPEQGAVFVELGAGQYLVQGILAASGAAIVATLLGTILALAGIPRRGALLILIALTPLVIPPSVYGIAWNALWMPPDSHWVAVIRISLCMGFMYAPIVLMLALAARSLQDPAVSESARLAGIGLIPRLVRIESGAIYGASSAGFLATFLLAFSNFEIPSALGYRSFPEAVYQRFQQTNSLGAPAAIAILGVLPAIVLACVCWTRIGKPAVRSLNANVRLPATTALAWPAWSLFVVAAVLLPAAALMIRIGGKLPLAAMRMDLLEGLRDTIPVVGAAWIACLVIGWIAADLVLFRRQAGLVILILSLLGMGIAPAVIGVGIIRGWIHLPNGGFVYGTNISFILALLARYLALPILVFAAARKLLPRDIEESASMAGIGFGRLHGRVLMPMTGMVWVALSASIAALMLGELGATTLLSSPGTELLSFRLHSRIHIGPENYVAAFGFLYAVAVLLLFIVLLMAGLWIIRGGKGEHGIS